MSGSRIWKDEYVERTFRHVAESRKLDFEVVASPDLPRVIHTDAKRLQQVLKNLLSNAFKFTSVGKVSMEIAPAESGWAIDNTTLNNARGVIAFSVTDTGIGIPPEKQQIIFEAFQQADGSTSRKYGGTGLGLAISREISRLLGGEIRLHSVPGGGRHVYALPADGMVFTAQAGATHRACAGAGRSAAAGRMGSWTIADRRW